MIKNLSPKRTKVNKLILSRRQREALTLKSNGLLDKQIAERMNISKSAVQIHLRAACDKLNANNTTQGVAIAVSRKFISEPKQPHIAELEHQVYSLGLESVASAFLEDRYNVTNSAGLPDKAVDEYGSFLVKLVRSAF